MNQTPTRRRRRAAFVPLRQVPTDSLVHGLWAGTKLLAVGAIGVTLSLYPWWPAAALMAGFLAVLVRMAHIPRGAWPRLPGWFFAALLFGAALAVVAGGPPAVHIGGARIELGSLEQLARFTTIATVLFVMSLLVGWTTSQADIGPALARLGGPLRRLRIPVDEWAVVVALCVRCLPLLFDEMRTLLAVRRLRPSAGRGSRPRPTRAWFSWWLAQPVDLLVAALVVAMRRAGELSEAITARGGVGPITAGSGGPGRRDGVALVLVAAVCAGAILLPAAS